MTFNKVYKIDEIWYHMIKNATNVKSTVKNLDGLAYWKLIKPSLKEINITDHSIQWNDEFEKIYESAKKQLQNIPENDTHNQLIEINHFLLQQFNIPHKDDGVPSFHRLIQIALNIGQFEGTIEDRNIYLNTIALYDKYSKKTKKRITYMDNDNVNKFDLDQDKYNAIIKAINDATENPPLENPIESDRYIIKYCNHF